MLNQMRRNVDDDDDVLIQRLIHYPSFPFSINISVDNIQLSQVKHIYDRLNDSIRLTIQKIGKSSKILVEIQNLIVHSFENITYSHELKNFNLQFDNYNSPEKRSYNKKKRKPNNNTPEIYENSLIEEDMDTYLWVSISTEMIQLLEIVLLSSQQCRHLFMGHNIKHSNSETNSRLILKGLEIPYETSNSQLDEIEFEMEYSQITLFDHFIESLQYYYQYFDSSIFKQIIDIINISLVEALLYDKSPTSPIMNNAIKKTKSLLLSPWFIDVFMKKQIDVKISCIELISSLLDIQDNFNFEGNANLLLGISELFKVHDFKDKSLRVQLTKSRLKSLRLLSKIMVCYTKTMLSILFPEKEVEIQPDEIISSFNQDQRTHFLCRIVMMIADQCEYIETGNENELESLNVINESLQLLLLYQLNAQIGPILRHVGQLFWNVISKLNKWKRMEMTTQCREIVAEIDQNLNELIKKISTHIPSLMSNVK